MTKRILGAWWVLMIGGCPTRTVYYDGGADATGGHGIGGQAGGAADGGPAGAAGAASSGEAGSPGRPGSAGEAGSTSGGAAGSSFAGAAGSSSGGAAGAASGGQGAGGGAGSTSSDPSGQGGGPAGSGGGHAGGAAGSSTPPKSKDGDRCALAGDCASGACTAFYVDLDGDGYGAGQAVGFCGTSAPVGYAAQPGDCCDTATNLAVAKLIHPGADFQSASAGGVCNITWDYDCSGATEKSWQACASCTAAPDCRCVYADFSDSECGTTQGGAGCSLVEAGPSQSCNRIAGGAGPVACR